MAVKTEKECFTEHLERLDTFNHEQLHHKGVAEHGHYHPGAGDHRSASEKSGASHHGDIAPHDNYKPEHGGYLHYHTHPHTHENDKDPLAELDTGANKIAVTEPVSATAYSETLFSHLGSGGDSLAEMGTFLDTFVN